MAEPECARRSKNEYMFCECLDEDMYGEPEVTTTSVGTRERSEVGRVGYLDSPAMPCCRGRICPSLRMLWT